jgi:hypothetical protein
MSVIYLRHHRHGTKVAMSDSEAALDCQNGWEEFDPTENDEDSVEDEGAEPVNVLQTKRRGRRPKEASA